MYTLGQIIEDAFIKDAEYYDSISHRSSPPDAKCSSSGHFHARFRSVAVAFQKAKQKQATCFVL